MLGGGDRDALIGDTGEGGALGSLTSLFLESDVQTHHVLMVLQTPVRFRASLVCTQFGMFESIAFVWYVRVDRLRRGMGIRYDSVRSALSVEAEYHGISLTDAFRVCSVWLNSLTAQKSEKLM